MDLRRKDWLRFSEAVEVLRPGEKLRRISWEAGKYLSVDIKLNILYLTKPDSIEEISINGKADFQKNQRFSSDSRIVIIYHSFKD